MNKDLSLQPGERATAWFPKIVSTALDGNVNVSASQSRRADTRRPPFDSVTIWLHWATAFIVLAMFASAWLR